MRIIFKNVWEGSAIGVYIAIFAKIIGYVQIQETPGR